MAETLGAWRALSPADAARLLAGLDAPWWIAGGWAVDLALGRPTRAHADIDIAVARRDQRALAEALADWDIHVAAGGVLTPWRPGDWLEGGRRHQFWARPEPDADWALEILLEESDGEDWVYRRDGRVRLPFARLGRRAPGGAPYLAPEVVLLFKANQPELPKNAADFETLLPRLDRAARVWLADALQAAHPVCPWLTRL
jgi:hypothetical protein